MYPKSNKRTQLTLTGIRAALYKSQPLFVFLVILLVFVTWVVALKDFNKPSKENKFVYSSIDSSPTTATIYKSEIDSPGLGTISTQSTEEETTITVEFNGNEEFICIWHCLQQCANVPDSYEELDPSPTP